MERKLGSTDEYDRVVRTRRKVFIWTQSEPRGPWQSRRLHDFGAPVWRVSWSTMGNILAVSDGNNTVTIWKESVDGTWNQISAAA